MPNIAFIALISIVLLSCKENKTLAEIGVTEVDIVFVNPIDGQEINGNATLSVDGRIDADHLMSGYSIRIQHGVTDSLLNEFQDLYVTSQFIVHHHWTPTVPEQTPMKITIDVLDDEHQVLATKTISVHCL